MKINICCKGGNFISFEITSHGIFGCGSENGATVKVDFRSFQEFWKVNSDNIIDYGIELRNERELYDLVASLQLRA